MFNGGGVSLLDYNQDGWLDVFFTSNTGNCQLYKNITTKAGDIKFENATQSAGINTNRWCYGSSIVDINQDGFPDIYISVAGHRATPIIEMKDYFFINNGKGGFTDMADAMGIADNGYSVQSVFFDADGDADLDMYLLRNSFVSYNRNQIRKKELDGLAESNDKLYRNEGLNTAGVIQFKEVSHQSGILIEGFGLGVSACDLDENGLTDIYATNDFLTNDLIWENDGQGKFSNKAGRYLKHQTYNAMGHDIADFNNDGLMDMVAVDMLPPDNKRWKLTMMGNRFDEHYQSLETGYEPQFVRNTLQVNTGFDQEGKPTYSEIGQMAGIHATEWSWSPLFADFDNDGWKDLFISNGYRQDVTNLDFIMYGKSALFMGTPAANRRERIKELEKLPGIKVPNVVYRNNRDLTFADVSNDWGIGTDATYSNGTAYGDLDNDGDLDLVINNLDQTCSLYANTTAQNNDNQWIRFSLKGKAPNRDAFGTKVWLWQGGQIQYQYYAPVRGYLSTCEPFLHFGLEPKNGLIDSIRVRWPDGTEQYWSQVQAKQVMALDWSQSSVATRPQAAIYLKNSTGYNEKSATLGLTYQHQEDAFIDFKTQALLPHLHSRFGPAMATADLNGDGLDDAVIGAAAGSTKKVFLQKPDGTFSNSDFMEPNLADDGGLLIFDADADKDMDLLSVAGGTSEQKNGTNYYASKLYINDGKGVFAQKASALPNMNSAAACPTASDFDHDGDLDLFVGGRVSPGEYPRSPRSYILKNDGKGNFTDATPEALKNIGMVCAALWADTDADGWQELILAGEFTPILICKNQNGALQSPTSVPLTNGWWNSIATADFDGDGDLDLIAGNRGENGFIKATPAHPVQMYAADFDKNGLIDPIMTWFWSGREQIAQARDDINKQIPPFRARFRTYNEYAEKSFEKSFRKDEISAAQTLKAETFASVYLENKQGNFTAQPLMNEAQMSTICDMLIDDLNADGKPDVVCVGNNFSTEVQNGRFDAQGSFVLMNTGRGQFQWQRQLIYADGDCKSVAKLKTANGNPLYLIGRNMASLLAFGR
jgi:enediyne biosynthesis protein E4